MNFLGGCKCSKSELSIQIIWILTFANRGTLTIFRNPNQYKYNYDQSYLKFSFIETFTVCACDLCSPTLKSIFEVWLNWIQSSLRCFSRNGPSILLYLYFVFVFHEWMNSISFCVRYFPSLIKSTLIMNTYNYFMLFVITLHQKL